MRILTQIGKPFRRLARLRMRLQKTTVANLCCTSGLVLLAVAGWLVAPALGLSVAGGSLIGLAVGLVRSEQLRKQREEMQ